MSGLARRVGIGVRWMLVLGLLAAVAPAEAHKLRVFALAEGDRISGSVYFAGGGAASGARIEVEDAEGHRLAELTPDAEGRFVYQVQAPIEHRVVAVTGDGHRAEWRVPASELAGARATTARADSDGAGRDTQPETRTAATSTHQPIESDPNVLAPGLESAIERALARQINPLREQLLAAEDQVRLRDILGGLGYILGLTGLALWWRCRARRREPGD